MIEDNPILSWNINWKKEMLLLVGSDGRDDIDLSNQTIKLELSISIMI